MFAAQIKRADLFVNDASNYVSEFTGAVRMEDAGEISPGAPFVAIRERET